ncbi:MAG: arginase family protein [Thermoproteota archaeon]
MILKQLSLIGVPTNSAGKKNGVAGAPAALRRAGLRDALGRFCAIHDEGDVSFSTPITERDVSSGIIACESLASMIQSVRVGVSRALSEGRFPLVVGGDCPVLLGCLAAASVRNSSIGLLFVDGHEDAYPARQSPTGEAADMELGFALGFGVPDLIREVMGQMPLIDPSRVCMLGPRDIRILQKTNIRTLEDAGVEYYYDDAALRKGNIRTLTRRMTRKLAAKAEGLWLHVDLDVLSTRSLQAVDYRQPGGLSWGQLEELTRSALSSCEVIGMDVTIYNPDLDPGRHFAQRIIRYLQVALVSMRSSQTVP